MTCKLGVDVGGTFTDVLLIDQSNQKVYMAKVPSTPQDSSIGVLNGISRACSNAGVDVSDISSVTHGTTVATNAILTGGGAKVGLITTVGYRQVLQIARSFVPGGLGGWVVYNKSEPLAPLECTEEVTERIGADGTIVTRLDEAEARRALLRLKSSGIEALTITLINSFTNDSHERRLKELAQDVVPEIPVSISSEVVPELQEYERTLTTVANSYVRPVVESYLINLQQELDRQMQEPRLSILRSDGGLSTAAAAREFPVNLLMSGPAGGVSGAVWVGRQSGFKNLLTFDMGGTSTDVSLIENEQPLLRRETTVGDVIVRASSLDVRTVGAGGGSIAYVPELTGALRVGPDSAGAVPGPAAYPNGGELPTVTDANVVLGYLPSVQKLGGDMVISRPQAEAAVQSIADAMGLTLHQAAEGIIKIVNENMFGALRLVSIEKGYDPRDFALMAFGGAGPLHANALGVLTQAWPVVIPPGPGVLCAYGDATTRLRDEASRTYIARTKDSDVVSIVSMLEQLEATARAAISATDARGQAQVRAQDVVAQYQVDLRYSGQGLVLTVDTTPEDLADNRFAEIERKFDALHKQLFTFALPAEKEFVNLRVVVLGPSEEVDISTHHSSTTEDAYLGDHTIYADGREHVAGLYQRDRLTPNSIVVGPAVIMEMDSTSLVLPDHQAHVDDKGNLLITPVEMGEAK
jgi:N-methylhydantoinase A